MTPQQIERYNALRNAVTRGEVLPSITYEELTQLDELCRSRFEEPTPGPWIAQFHGMPHLIATIRTESNHCVAAVEGTDGGTKGCNRANALLLAAAPAMRDALRLVVKYQQLVQSGSPHGLIQAYGEAFDSAQRALAQVDNGGEYDSEEVLRLQNQLEDYCIKIDTMRSALLVAGEYIRTRGEDHNEESALALEAVVVEALQQADGRHDEVQS